MAKSQKEKLENIYKKNMPGFFAFLHTYGRPLNFNPHIHVIIAETRILKYDGNNITWYYSDYKHEQYHEVTESAFSFITKILRHLLSSNYKSIRYFGFYNISDKIDNEANMIIKKEKIPFMKSLLKWKNSILTSFHRIPIKCPKCGHLMDPCFEVL